MDIAIAQKRVDDIAAAMLAKGMREPQAQIWVKSNEETSIFLQWKSGLPDDRHYGADRESKFFRGTPASTLEDAANWVAEQPDAEQAKLRDFLSALGKVVDIGKQHGIEADYLNPLVASMKKLSENVITDQRAA